MAYGEGSLDRAGLKALGITAGNTDYQEGSSTGVKGNPLLGEGYLDKKTYQALQRSKEFKKAYTSLGGDFTAEKFDEGISLNNMDAAIDKLTKGQAESTEQVPPEKRQLSPTAAKAVAHTQAFDDFRQSGGYVDMIMGDTEARDSFMNDYKINLQKLSKGKKYGDATATTKSTAATDFLKVKKQKRPQ